MAYIGSLLLILFEVGLDQFSKQLVVSFIKEFEKLEVIPNFFNITYVKNTGAAWSMLDGQKGIFIIISIAAVVYFAYEFIKNKDEGVIFKLSCLFIIGGAIGNMIDRIINGYVVDFLDFYIFSYDFPVFNVADCFITVGIILYLIVAIMEAIHAKDQVNN